MIIIGAGMAGLLAGHYFADSVIYEKQLMLPDNHGALLRFRTDAVAKLTGIPFSEVMVYKGVVDRTGVIRNDPTISDMNAYSFKVTGKVLGRSIMNLSPGARFIAPGAFTTLLSSKESIIFGRNFSLDDILARNKEPIISTMPMPILMKMLQYPNATEFVSRKVTVMTAYLKNVDVYQTLYLTDPRTPAYRVSITGNKLTVEYIFDEEKNAFPFDSFFFEDLERYMFLLFGHLQHSEKSPELLNVRTMQLGKIMPIGEIERQAFMLWATDNFNIYSLGRFACWRNILLDDVVKDLARIRHFISIKNQYTRKASVGVGL